MPALGLPRGKWVSNSSNGDNTGIAMYAEAPITQHTVVLSVGSRCNLATLRREILESLAILGAKRVLLHLMTVLCRYESSPLSSHSRQGIMDTRLLQQVAQR